MTGIERLRKLADDYVTCSLSEPGRNHGRLLRDIADQIEREQGEMAAESPHNAITPKDREAAAWVREHGGLERVKAQRRESMQRAAYERKKAGFLDHIAECETALGRRREIISELNRRACDLTRENAELRKRAMPDGYEWPRYASGELVQIGDDVVGRFSDDPIKVRSVEFREGVTYLCDGCNADRMILVHPGQHVRRPAVLAADGEPLEVGQTVWHEETGRGPWIVVRASNGQATVEEKANVTVTYDGDMLTHRARVLAADGKPLLKHETVYEIETGDRYFVTRLFDGMTEPDFPEHTVECRKYEDVVTHMFRPSQLTHKRPALGADGVPIKVGDVVWCAATDDELTDMNIVRKSWSKIRAKLTVKNIIAGSHGDKWADFEETYLYVKTCYLTHAKPEPPKRCRDCAHWQKDPTADNMGVCWFYYHEHEGQDCYAARRGDIGACEEFMPQGKELAGDA